MEKYNLGVPESSYNAAMDRSELAKACAGLRVRYKVPMRELAKALGSAHASGWQYYETRVAGAYLDAAVAEKIAPVFERYGADPSEIWALVAPQKKSGKPTLKADDDDIVEAIEDELAYLGIEVRPSLRSRLALGVAERLKRGKPGTR